LKQRIEELQKHIADKERENIKLWENLDKEVEERRKLTDTVSKQTLMLEDMRFKAEKTSPEARKGFLARLLG
jgi:3-phosphoglycerate kinase